MAVTLFMTKDCRGRSLNVSRSVAALRDTSLGTSPASMQTTLASDAVLLFKQKDFKGNCLCRRGRHTIRDLGSAKEGGKYGFGNTVSSIRLEPFVVQLNITIVQKPDGTLPGLWTSVTEAEIEAIRIVERANRLLANQQALLNLDIDIINHFAVRESEEKFNLRKDEKIRFPADWKAKGKIDTIFVNSFTKPTVLGTGYSPGFGKTVMVAKTAGGVLFPTDTLAAILLHEIGHYLGLSHRSSRKDVENIMAPNLNTDSAAQLLDAAGDPSFDHLFFDEEQIEEMHNKLAENLYRKGDRQG